MSEILRFADIQPMTRQTIDDAVVTLFENNCPTYRLFEDMQEAEINEGGVRIRMEKTRPGGHGAWHSTSSDFNRYVAPKFDNMFIFPVGYALPRLQTGAQIRGIKRNQKDVMYEQAALDAAHYKAAEKRINRMLMGDKSGTLAVSSSNIVALGSATMNCTTTAAATAGQTKGARYLEEDHFYNACDPTTRAIRGIFQVTTPGASSCTINLLSGTISSGDLIVDVNSIDNWWPGLAHLIDNTSRVLQGQNTGTVPALNDYVIDLNGAPCTPITIEAALTSLETRENNSEAKEMLNCLHTHGQNSLLRRQGYGFRQYVNNYNTAQGVPKEYEDGGVRWHKDSNYDDDRFCLWKDGTLKRYVEMAFGEYNLDGQTLRMLLGENSTGSDNYQSAIGIRMAVGKVKVRSAVLIKRASLPGETEVTTA